MCWQVHVTNPSVSTANRRRILPSVVVRTKREEVNSPTVAHTIATWDDETGDAGLVEYGHGGQIRRRAVISHWPDVGDAKPGDVVGETIWYGPDGTELERRPILEPSYE